MLVFRQELRFQRHSWLIWVLSLFLFLTIFMTIFPAFEKEAEEFTTMLENLPPFMTLGIGLDYKDIFTLEGFVAFTNLFIKLLLAVLGALWGLQICGRETINHMGEFLLCKPQSRMRIMLQKILAGLVLIVLLNAVLFGITLAFKLNYQENTMWQKTLAASTLDFFLQLFFFSLGGALGMILRRIKNPVAIASGLGFAFFMMLMLGRIMQNDFVLNLTPFHYSDQIRFVAEGFNPTDCFILLGTSIIFLVSGVWCYVSKDVEA